MLFFTGSGCGAPKSPDMSSTSTAGQAVGSPEGAVGGAQFDETRSMMNDLPAQMFGKLMVLSNKLSSDPGFHTFYFAPSWFFFKTC